MIVYCWQFLIIKIKQYIYGLHTFVHFNEKNIYRGILLVLILKYDQKVIYYSQYKYILIIR